MRYPGTPWYRGTGRYHPVPHIDRVPRGTGYRDEEPRCGTRGYRVPGWGTKVWYRGVPGTRIMNRAVVPRGTGMSNRGVVPGGTGNRKVLPDTRLRNLGGTGYQVQEPSGIMWNLSGPDNQSNLDFHISTQLPRFAFWYVGGLNSVMGDVLGYVQDLDFAGSFFNVISQQNVWGVQ